MRSKRLKEKDLHDYQNRVVDHIIELTHNGLFLEMGLGKTVSTLTAANKLIHEELEINNALVVGPKRVIESVWTAEIKKWEHLKHLKTVRIIGTPKQRQAALKEKADIYLISRDNLAWLIGQYGGSMLPFDMLIADESSSFKNHDSIRFKSIKKVLPSFKRVTILTGTPAPNGLIDLWPQIYLLDLGERLGKTITAYRERYFRPDSFSGYIVHSYKIQNGSEEDIHAAISDICISMKSKDYIDLPDRIDNYITLPMSKSLSKKYFDFEKEKIIEIAEASNGGVIPAANAAALSNKLLQFANGAVYDEDKNYHDVHDLKIKATEDLIEAANGNPVLIFWTYRHDLHRLRRSLKKYNPVSLKNEEDIEDWNKGKIQILMMHPASGGHGLNLQDGGNIVIWFGQTWSLEYYQQANARLHRQGQTKPVIINHLILENTMDEDVVDRLEGKSTRQDDLMAAIKARMEKYIK